MLSSEQYSMSSFIPSVYNLIDGNLTYDIMHPLTLPFMCSYIVSCNPNMVARLCANIGMED